MFHYFGYGSNLSVVSLRAKGVNPLRHEPAILEGWRLSFEVPDFFAIEGGSGHIERCEGEAVHGALYACRDAHLGTLDQLEASGIRYERIEATVATYGGRRVRAYVYVGIPAVLERGCLPSERYRNILVNGAVELQLDAAYVERLRAMPTAPRKELVAFTLPPGPRPVLTHASLAAQPSLTALAGVVFDMSNARRDHDYLRRLLGGKDATLFFLKRMDTSDGAETFEDLRRGRLDGAQRQYLDAYLHAFSQEYRLVGELRYEAAPDGVPENLLGGGPVGGDRPRTRPSTAPPSAPSGIVRPSRPALRVPVPTRIVVAESERHYERTGHENLGFLSEEYGFMPRTPPSERLPPAYAAWDQIAGDLPRLYRTLRLRREVDALPILPAGDEDLADAQLLRACTVLSMLSHAYHYVETHPPAGPPESLARPWATVRQRLDRGPAVLSYVELIVYNWRLLDPSRADPMRVDNMRLLVPTVDNDEERIFYLTQTEILAQASPIVGAVVRAQEAVVADDREALECELATIIESLQRVVRESLLNINPNQGSRTHVDPVIWAKTVAPFAVPTIPGVQGPSGTSSPIFNMLDIFFGRRHYETFLGREIRDLRATYPRFWRDFLVALQEISVPTYIARTQDLNLRGLLQEAVATYAGENGFLGRHRMKVYGYIELAFKVGRSVTIGGFKGVFKDRTWDQVDRELAYSRAERVQSFPQSCYHVRVQSVESDVEGVSHVVLDVSGTGLRYEAGDRCGVLPENDDALLYRTLAALGARGDEPVPLNREWQDAVRLRAGYEGATSLRLEEVLRFGRIRPLLPRAAEALHAESQDEALEAAMSQQMTEHWELWDALELLRERGFDCTRLWQRDGEPVGAICRVIPPEMFRMYSISSVMTSASTGAANQVRLTVGRIRYETASSPDSHVTRYGTASSFLTRAAERRAPVSVVVQHPARFGLPRDPRVPIVMLAGGTGLSPFRGFLVERMRQLDAGRAWLFLGLRSRQYLRAYEEEFAPALRRGVLELRVAFSRDDVDARWVDDGGGTGHIGYEPGTRRQVPDLMRDDDAAQALWDLVRAPAEGGQGGYVYVCGRAGFARGVIDGFKEVLRRFASGTQEERRARAEAILSELMSEGRFMQEIFSGGAPAVDVARSFEVSEIVRHNDEANGHWLVIEGRVYDISEFLRMHPGGGRILRGYAGLDASDGYARAHEGRSEIDAMREMYELGVVRPLDLSGVSATVQGPAGAQVVSLAAAYRAWVRMLYLVVEMQNALENDQDLQRAATTRDEPIRPRSSFRLQRAVETHERFLRSYVEGLATESFPSLWAITQGLFAPEAALDWMRAQIDTIQASEDAVFVAAMVPELQRIVQELVARDVEIGTSEWPRVADACEILDEENRRFLAAVKETLRAGVRGFEVHGRAMHEAGAPALVRACRTLPIVLRAYYGRCVARLRDTARWAPTMDLVEPARPTAERRRVTLVASPYYVMEEDPDRRVVMLHRTPVAFESLEQLEEENEHIIRQIRADHADYGVVVDMRQAPVRNDPAFESSMRRLRAEVTQRFARLAVLLESAVGVLQVNRLDRDEGQKTFATRSEAAAIGFAAGRT